jgi:hypothetical protein
VLIKNVASQKVPLFLVDDDGDPQTGEVANITVNVVLDGGSETAYTNNGTTYLTELDATNHAGVYLFDIPQAETNGEVVVMHFVHTTATYKFRPDVLTLSTKPDWDTVLGATFSATTDSLEAIRRAMEDSTAAISRS